jgi:hypothetical protein
MCRLEALARVGDTLGSLPNLDWPVEIDDAAASEI